MSQDTKTTETNTQDEAKLREAWSQYQQPRDKHTIKDPRPADYQAVPEAYRRESDGQFYAMPYQDRVAFEIHCAAMIADLAPQTARERWLAQSIAQDTWRLSRARAIENNIYGIAMSGALGQATETDRPEAYFAMVQARTWLKDGTQIQKLSLYEQRIRKGVEKNEKQLKALQAERKAEYAQALEEAKLLAHLAMAEGRTFDPQEDFEPGTIGFGFSADYIMGTVRREMRLQKAIEYAKQNKPRAAKPTEIPKAA